MAEAEPVIRAVLPDANVPTSIRGGGVPVVHGSTSDLGAILDAWLAEHAEGIACVIGDPTLQETSRVRSLSPELSKGLEFDLVVLIDPEKFGKGVEGAVDRYVAMTRATQRLVILTREPEQEGERTKTGSFRSKSTPQPSQSRTIASIEEDAHVPCEVHGIRTKFCDLCHVPR
ncbi:hypothetical protein Mth01_01680 [Sphaerimonospora thailandensis]|uniref:DNA helicase n=1 Tax=Sphaerimonospora thailandensis TaxID=795644 RepID=A0A8J3R3V7_9ACTN|nr:hypothetical protein Mth01_01680 [Sphaerimonospora thailandensis]